MNIGGHIVSILLLCFVLANAKYFKFQDCTGKDGIAEISTFRISPDPVSLKKNMTADMTAKILREIPSTAVVKIGYYKQKSLFGVEFDVPIPCLLGKFGSCTMLLCEYLDMYKEQLEGFFPEGYGCPVKAGDYGGEDVDVRMPYIPPIARIVVGGKYRAELRLFDKRGGKELACYKIWAEMH